MFSHKINRNNAVKNEEVKKLERKLKDIELELEKQNGKILKLENEMKDVYLKVSEKDQTISKINKKQNVLYEKMKVDFESRFEILRKRLKIWKMNL